MKALVPVSVIFALMWKSCMPSCKQRETVKNVNYFSFSYPYVCFKCSSLSVPEGGQLILHTVVSTKRTVVMCLTILYKRVESSVLRKNANKNRKPFCFLLSEAFLRGHIKLKLVVNLVWKLFHQKDSGLYLERTVVSTFFKVELFHFPASCIQR